MEFIKSPRIVTIIVLTTVFVLGLLSGWSLGARYGTRKLDRLTYLSMELNPQVLEDHAIKSLTYRLSLTPDEVQQIRPIMSSGIAEVIEVRRDALQKINDCRNRGLDKVSAVLTPEQQTKLRDLMKKRDEELKQQLKNSP